MCTVISSYCDIEEYANIKLFYVAFGELTGYFSHKWQSSPGKLGFLLPQILSVEAPLVNAHGFSVASCIQI